MTSIGGIAEKVVIVTGASSGIGLAASTLLVSNGAKVLGLDISPGPATLASNPAFKFVQCDLTKSTAAAEAVQAARTAFGGRIDGLLNVAGIMDTNNSVDTLTDEAWDRVIAVNLTAPVKLMREVVRVMKTQGGGGSIVNISSKAGMSGAAAGVAYTSSKHGLIGATKNVAWRFKDDGIRCNAILPGGTATNITKSVNMNDMDVGGSAAIKPVIDLHLGDRTNVSGPETVANLLAFLVSDLSKDMNGAMIPVDNAWSVI